MVGGGGWGYRDLVIGMEFIVVYLCDRGLDLELNRFEGDIESVFFGGGSS